MLLSSKNSDVGIGASSPENKSSRSNSSEPIMLSVLLNTTSMSTVRIAPMFIPFMDVSMHWYCLSHNFLLSELSAWIRALDSSSRWWVLGQFILHTCQATDQLAAGM